MLSYQWTCPGGCDAGAVDPEWAATIQRGNILVVNVRTHVDDDGTFDCTVENTDSMQQVGKATHTFSVASECIYEVLQSHHFVLKWHGFLSFITELSSCFKLKGGRG